MIPYTQTLAKNGYQVAHFASPRSAIAYAQKHWDRIVLVISEMSMPHGDEFTHSQTNGAVFTGIAIETRLRSSGLGKTPVIFLATLAPKYVPVGISDRYFTKKTVDPTALLGHVRSRVPLSPLENN
jgi:CheY-like chemotaxis protein